MKRLLALVFVFFLLSCDSGFHPSNKMSSVNEIRRKAASKIQNETGLIPSGTTGRMLDQIRIIGLLFDYRRPITLEETREKVVKAADTLLKEINSNEPVRQYLITYPFNSQNIKILIFIQKPDRTSVEDEKLCVVGLSEGRIEYEVHDSLTHQLKKIHTETYEEALQLLNQENRSQAVQV